MGLSSLVNDSTKGSTMAHQPPKQQKKKPQQTAKEKKAIKQQKKHDGEAPVSGRTR
jgi:hypothetical protein